MRTKQDEIKNLFRKNKNMKIPHNNTQTKAGLQLSVFRFPMMAFFTLMLFSCNGKNGDYDASGTFEADEIMVVAEASGTILELNIQEGENLKEGQNIGLIDGKNIELQKEQVLASINAIDEKTNSATPQIQILEKQYHSQKAQISVLQEELKNAVRERNRTASLVKSDAATKKQLDDWNGQINVIQKQIDAAQSQLSTFNQQMISTKENINIQNRSVLSEKAPNRKKILQIDDQLKHNIISSPVNGTVLTQYMYKGEFATIGKPVFKMADLKDMILRVYVTGDQLSKIKLNQEVNVMVGNGEQESKPLKGKIIWISSEAEFTPKTIQTKDERANLVYAVKVKVKNDGFLKIGMYADVKF